VFHTLDDVVAIHINISMQLPAPTLKCWRQVIDPPKFSTSKTIKFIKNLYFQSFDTNHNGKNRIWSGVGFYYDTFFIKAYLRMSNKFKLKYKL
jgi:hypothetical protein